MMLLAQTVIVAVGLAGFGQTLSTFDRTLIERYRQLDEKEALGLRRGSDLLGYLDQPDAASLPPRSDHAAVDGIPGRLPLAICVLTSGEDGCASY